MKDIMKDLTIEESKWVATEKWREYVTAERIYRKPEYTDLKKIYNQVKGGRKVIDIFKVIQRGGVRENYHPVLAIAQVTTKKVYCKYLRSGQVYYVNRQSRWTNGTANPTKNDIDLPNCLPAYSMEDAHRLLGDKWGAFQLSAPVPPVPPSILPRKITDDYYILWEVDKWTNDPPTDPWLLRRITKNMFVVLGGWDLTEIEKSVMRGRML